MHRSSRGVLLLAHLLSNVKTLSDMKRQAEHLPTGRNHLVVLSMNEAVEIAKAGPTAPHVEAAESEIENERQAGNVMARSIVSIENDAQELARVAERSESPQGGRLEIKAAVDENQWALLPLAEETWCKDGRAGIEVKAKAKVGEAARIGGAAEVDVEDNVREA